MKIKQKYDHTQLGLVLGILLPILSFIVLWAFKNENGLINYIQSFYRIGKLSNLVSLSVIPNLLLFFLFIWTERNRSARGVLLATFVFAFIIALLKFT